MCFPKASYPRIDGDKLGGQVTRLLITPLLAALRKVCGDSSYLRSTVSAIHWPVNLPCAAMLLPIFIPSLV